MNFQKNVAQSVMTPGQCTVVKQTSKNIESQKPTIDSKFYVLTFLYIL